MDRRIKEISLKTSLSAIADLAMPRVCVVCGTPLIPQENHICMNCLADMPLTHFERMSHNPMADRFNSKISETGYCNAAALYYYREDAGYKNISQALKYHRNFSAGEFFGSMLGERLATSALFEDVDLVIPVPLHWTRKWKRGYNQAEIIASAVSRTLGCTMDSRSLTRIRRTSSQTKLSGRDKDTNVASAFRCRPLTAGHILLIDDVLTSGSTLAACHAAIRPACTASTRISAATLAFVDD